ncbi:DUF222 domain-containing protein [Pseudonocardia sp. KRD-291]|nr:DUF222 domain-containing protein [Pseudonocardia sp. KRD291]
MPAGQLVQRRSGHAQTLSPRLVRSPPEPRSSGSAEPPHYPRPAAEFDARGSWAGPGLRSCAHWLGWRVGLDHRTARDHLRVAHALTRLPATTEAFAAGRISYSKVRALTRVATANTEHHLLVIALHGTTAH